MMLLPLAGATFFFVTLRFRHLPPRHADCYTPYAFDVIFAAAWLTS